MMRMPRILAVDDSPSLRQMVAHSLGEAGFEVIEAIDGNDGLEKAVDSDPDVILTDVNMPGLNGIELTSELRKLDAFRFTPILVLTTESSRARKEQGRAAGATGWIVKPFNPEKLVATIRRVLPAGGDGAAR